jgi:hypothetical protein
MRPEFTASTVPSGRLFFVLWLEVTREASLQQKEEWQSTQR